jgi:ATP-binding cassette subfamily G (WHITE) protein 2 (PDR)
LISHGTPDCTAGFRSKGSALFDAVLLNAPSASSKINNLYRQRPIAEKDASYAFYHPATEAAAGIVGDIPIKLATATAFNLIMYFMSGLRQEPGPFSPYFLVSFLTVFFMSAVSKTISQAMALGGVLILAKVIYTGLVIGASRMRPWFSWNR